MLTQYTPLMLGHDLTGRAEGITEIGHRLDQKIAFAAVMLTRQL